MPYFVIPVSILRSTVFDLAPEKMHASIAKTVRIVHSCASRFLYRLADSQDTA